MRDNLLEYTRADGSTATKAIRGNEVYFGMMGARSVDLSSVHEPRYIRVLWLYENQLEEIDLSPLRDFIRLESLSLRGNELRTIDLKPLSSCERLRRLDLSNNQIRTLDLAPLQSCVHLEGINIGGNPFTNLDLGIIGSMPELRELILTLEPSAASNDTQAVSSTSKEQGSRHVGAQERLKLDLTSLFWSTTLESVIVGPSDVLHAEALLKHIALSQVQSSKNLITSAPKPAPRPAVLWLDSFMAHRMHWIRYEQWHEASIGSLLNRLKQSLKRIDSNYWFHAQKGMMEALGLDWISGYDGPPLDLLKSVESSNTFEELQQDISETAAELLQRQMSTGGSTLFISIDDLIANGFLDLASEVVDARKKEIECMRVPVHEGYASIRCLMLSEYGFRMCQELGIKEVRVSEDSFDELRDALATAGIFLEKVDVPSFREFQHEGPNTSKSLADFVLKYYILVS